MDRKSCDAVIVGAGIGSLCLAARLTHAGIKTIVLERMPILGGRFIYAEYKGYYLPAAATYLMYGESDPILQTLRDVGCDEDLNLRSSPLPRWRIGGSDFDMPERGVLWHLISLTSRDKQEEERVIKATRRCYLWQEPSDYTTFSEWLLQVTDNKQIYRVFNALSVQLGGPNIWEYPAGQFFRELRSQSGVRQLLPERGLSAIVDALAREIRLRGGELLPSTEVTSISVQDGEATGVEATGRSGPLTVEAKMVVSNVGPKMTVALAGEDNFDRGYLKRVKEIVPIAILQVHIASDGPLYDHPGGLYTLDTRVESVWIDCTLTWPQWAPKGRNWMLVARAPESMTLYDPKKQYQIFLADLAETFPNFKSQNGEILTVHHYCADWPAAHAIPGQDLPVRTPIENLYNVGDGVKPSGRIAGAGASESARMVADDIISTMRRRAGKAAATAQGGR